MDKIEIWEDAEARSLDTEGLKELMESIRREGLQNPPLVQKDSKGGSYRLISGQRRFEALRRLGAKRIPVMILKRSYDLQDAKAASIIENLHRKQMLPHELAEACDYLAKTIGSKRKAARMLGISQTTFRQYQGYKGVPDELKELVKQKKITRGESIRLSKIVSNINDAVEIAHRISKFPTVAARRRYLDAVEKDPKAPHPVLRRMARHYREKEKVRLKLTPAQAKSLATAAVEKSLEPEELAQKIVGEWLSRRGYKTKQ